MPDIRDLMRDNLLGVFNQRDATARLTAIERLHAPDVVFVDAEGTVTGHEALHEKAESILGLAPDHFVFTPTGPIHAAGDLGLLTWGFGPPNGAPAVTGTDVALFADGRIVRLYTLLASSE